MLLYHVVSPPFVSELNHGLFTVTKNKKYLFVTTIMQNELLITLSIDYAGPSLTTQ